LFRFLQHPKQSQKQKQIPLPFRLPPFQGGETRKIFSPFLKGEAVAEARGFHSQNPHKKNRPPAKAKERFLFYITSSKTN